MEERESNKLASTFGIGHPRTIILNQIKTPDGTILRSFHRHDYNCYEDMNGKTYGVDGGPEYLKRIGDMTDCEELSVYSDDSFENIRKALHRGGRGKDGKKPLTWTPLCEMSDEWVENSIIYNEQRNMGEHLVTIFYRAELEYRKENGISISD